MRIIAARLLLGVLLLTAPVVYRACEDSTAIAAGFKAGLAASRPFVTSLVDSGAITQAQSVLAVADLSDGVASVDKAITCLKGIVSSGTAKRIDKAKCYYGSAGDLRTILARHHFDGPDMGSGRLHQLSTIIAGAIEAFEAYYTAVNARPAVSGPDGGITNTGADGASGEDADQQLGETLKDLKKQLDAVTKGS